jgi:hypothetical protein
MAQHGSPQSIGDGALQGEGNPEPRRRDDKAARDFDEASQPDKGKRKADDPGNDGDAAHGDGPGRSRASEDAASPRR